MLYFNRTLRLEVESRVQDTTKCKVHTPLLKATLHNRQVNGGLSFIMGKYSYEIGQKFGHLTLLSLEGKECNSRLAKFQCDCGNVKILRLFNVICGHTKSCSCGNYRQKRINKGHGLSNTRLYKCWKAIKVRCYNKNDRAYKHYGFRGITMCDDWKNDFMAFYKWAMGNGYKENLTIDRIDVNGNYEPSNCRWITIKEQNSNKTNNFIVKYMGKNYVINHLAKKLNVDRNTLRRRIEKGIDESMWGDKAERYKITVVYNGEKYILKELAKEKGINFQTLKNRLYAGWSVEKAIETPVNKNLSRVK